MSSAAEAAVEAIAQEVAVDLLRKGQLPPSAERELREQAAEAAETVSEPPSAAAEEQPAPFDFNPVVPEEIEELLAEFQEEPEQPIEVVSGPVEQPYAEYEDEQMVKLRAELARERKRREFLEQQRVARDRPAHVAEARKYFPLCEPDQITEVSRRGILRVAKEQHEFRLAALKPFLEANEAQVKAQVEARLADEKQRLEAAWGRPTVGPSTVPSEASNRQADIEAARKTGSLQNVIAAMFKHGEVRV